MFGWFKKKKVRIKQTFNYESLMVDMHSHVLPGIDDGAQNVGESIEMIRAMMDLGIKKIIATPHVMFDYYRNTPETINNALALLKAELKAQQIDIVVEASAEYFFEEQFEEIIDKGLLLPIKQKYVLFEFSFISAPPVFFPTIQKLIDGGYQPILAHPERYAYLEIDQMKNIKNWGCDLQINSVSLTGYYGKEAKHKAEEMIDNRLVDFISSDMHHMKHAKALKMALTSPYMQKVMFDYPLKNELLF
jgi:protein-tyrosine phosphatase